MRCALVLQLLLAVGSGAVVDASNLGPPPVLREFLRQLCPAPRPEASLIDTSDRAAVVDLYDTVYVPGISVPVGFTGSASTCTPGGTSAAFKTAILARINYFREMAGLPAVALDATLNGKCQDAALMMAKERSLSHDPGPAWGCYTADGAEAASKSNLGLQWPSAGVDFIDNYIEDSGAFNTPVGHRRWVLYPPQATLGSGTAHDGAGYHANSLWVLGPFGSRPGTPAWVSWPPPGFVPAQITYPRWSFSYPSADFSAATVTMTKDGAPIVVSLLTVDDGYGDNTLVWEPQGLPNYPSAPPTVDDTYLVTVANVMVGATPMTFPYTVTVIDPSTAGATYDLTVTKRGRGTGSVASVPAGVDCGATCSASFAEDTSVTLGATPTVGALFRGFGGDVGCGGTFSITADRECTATFDLTLGAVADELLGLAAAPGDANCNVDGNVDVLDLVCIVNNPETPD